MLYFLQLSQLKTREIIYFNTFGFNLGRYLENKTRCMYSMIDDFTTIKPITTAIIHLFLINKPSSQM